MTKNQAIEQALIALESYIGDVNLQPSHSIEGEAMAEWSINHYFAILTALQQPAKAVDVPEGWQLVPIEPTSGMLKATKCGWSYDSVYRAMIAAAPAPNSKKENDDE